MKVTESPLRTYIERATERVLAGDQAIAPWLLKRCTACAFGPDGEDEFLMDHAVVNGYVITTCDRQPIINPAVLDLPADGWWDWREDEDVIDPDWQ